MAVVKYIGIGGKGTSNSDANAQLVDERIKSVATKRKQGELALAKQRDEVIYKNLVEKQASYLMVNLRQKILNLPSTYARRFLGLTEVNLVQDLLRELSLSLLSELKDLPNTVTDPNWLLKLEKKEQQE